jgi:uncharacterized membrane protein YkvA (DUF1232 family)
MVAMTDEPTARPRTPSAPPPPPPPPARPELRFPAGAASGATDAHPAGPPPGTDPFPRERLGAMLRRAPKYARLGWRLGKDPMLSKARRVAVVAAAGYLVSPVDLVPGFIPVLGQLDDLAFALAALRLALDGLHPDRRRMHLEAVGLEDAHLTDDIRTVAATMAWIARRSLRVTGRLLREGAHLAEEGAEIGLRTTMSVAGRAKDEIGSRLGRVGRRIHGERPNEGA